MLIVAQLSGNIKAESHLKVIALRFIGIIYTDQGKYKKALKVFEDVLKILTGLGYDSKSDSAKEIRKNIELVKSKIK